MVIVGKLREEVERLVFHTFSWPFYLSIISSIATVITAVIIGLFNEYFPSQMDYNSYNSVAKPAVPAVSYSAQKDELYDRRISQVGYMGPNKYELDL